MTITLADSFLLDLDDLSSSLGNEANNVPNDDDLDSVSKLQNTKEYVEIMEKVDDALQKKENGFDVLEEDDPEYQLILDCNELSVDIENEMVIIHNFIRDNYRFKFPELESLVQHPVDYARVVKKIGNEMDLTLVDLEQLLPSTDIMVVSVTASTTSGKPLPVKNIRKTIDACDRAITLDIAKRKVVEFLESTMRYIAPNLSAIVGSAVAAKLIGTAGSMSALANMPACNVQLLGVKKKNLAGFSSAATSQFRISYIEQTEIVQNTPPLLKTRVCRLLASKSTLAARVDSIRNDPTGKTGRTFREEICKKIEKWQEPPLAKQPKRIPVPVFNPKGKRGGLRLRKMKERYGITDMMKLANKMPFGILEESSLGDGLGIGYGMLGWAGNGKLCVSVGQNKLAAKAAKKLKGNHYGRCGSTSGLTSTFALTPVQGIELLNPQALGNQLGSGTQGTYFSEIGSFSKN